MGRSQRQSPSGACKGRQAKVLVLHGPNLNLLGTREPVVCGRETLGDINRRLTAQAEAARGAELTAVQSNHEDVLVDRFHAARAEGVGFIIIDPAGFTHTSVALRAALSGVAIPLVEIHLSNVHAREPFCHRSYWTRPRARSSGSGPKATSWRSPMPLRHLSAR